MEQHVTIGAGRALFKQGDKGGDLYFIIEGTVDLLVRNETTGEEIVISTLGPKSVLGTMSFLESDPRSATAMAKSEVKFLKITEQNRDKLLKTIPNWFRILIKDMSSSLRRLNQLHVKLVGEHELIKKKLGIREKNLEKLQQSLTSLQNESSETSKNLKAELDQARDKIKSTAEENLRLSKEIEKLKKAK